MRGHLFLKISGLLTLILFIVGGALLLERTPPENFPASELPAAEKIASTVLGTKEINGFDKTSGISFSGRDRKIVYVTGSPLPPTATPKDRAEAFRGRLMSLPGTLPETVSNVDVTGKPECTNPDNCKAKGVITLENGTMLKVAAFVNPETGEGTIRLSVEN